MLKWYQCEGAENDVVISTKVHLSRNIKGYNFTVKLLDEEMYEISDKVEDVLESRLSGKFVATPMEEMGRDLQISLAERGLISPEFASSSFGRTIISTEDESLSIMVCEEDHLKIQALLPGIELEKAYELVDTLDQLLDSELTFSFDEKLGYLTQCPTNIGTAMRASVTLQLPALSIKGQIPKLSNMVSKLGLVLTGAYGGGDKPLGALFMLSNQVTLGISEQAAIENLKAISFSIAEQERTLRLELMNNLSFQDLFWRAMGTLKNARVLSLSEFMEQVAIAKVGLSEIDAPVEKINELLFAMQPATLNVEYGDSLDKRVRRIKRADRVREIFR
ncbi:MAG: ATP--guanido phosphotransferase [Ruminococcaceae bacterium]|nr:ATP--guanido phosphotransferase [Oscillospiraceae bacterium]